MKGEFHIHTTYSDGLLTVREVMDVLKGNLDWFCITDHDVIDGSIEAYNIQKEYNLNALIGVEISTYYKNEPVHILGYFKDDKKIHIINNFFEVMSKLRKERLFKMKDLLLKYFNIDLDVTNMLPKRSVTRGTIATEIINQGFPYKREEIFQKLIGNDSPAYVPVARVEPKEAIDLIHSAGGTAVLAHPKLLKKVDFRDICNMGIDGIEAYYPVNKEEDTKLYLNYAKEHGLVVTAGNDFHYEGCLNHGSLLELSLEGQELDDFINRVYKG